MDIELSDNVQIQLNRLKTTEKARDELEKDKAKAEESVKKQIEMLAMDCNYTYVLYKPILHYFFM